jgi:hypothetical protein
MPDLMQMQPEDSRSNWSEDGARLNRGYGLHLRPEEFPGCPTQFNTFALGMKLLSRDTFINYSLTPASGAS